MKPEQETRETSMSWSFNAIRESWNFIKVNFRRKWSLNPKMEPCNWLKRFLSENEETGNQNQTSSRRSVFSASESFRFHNVKTSTWINSSKIKIGPLQRQRLMRNLRLFVQNQHRFHQSRLILDCNKQWRKLPYGSQLITSQRIYGSSIRMFSYPVVHPLEVWKLKNGSQLCPQQFRCSRLHSFAVDISANEFSKDSFSQVVWWCIRMSWKVCSVCSDHWTISGCRQFQDKLLENFGHWQNESNNWGHAKVWSNVSYGLADFGTWF